VIGHWGLLQFTIRAWIAGTIPKNPMDEKSIAQNAWNFQKKEKAQAVSRK